MVIESMPQDIFLDGEIWYTYALCFNLFLICLTNI